MRVEVSVPATSANLGPGFDCLGMALSLHNRLVLTFADSPAVTVEGEGVEDLPRDESNLAYQSAVAGFEMSGRAAPAFEISMKNDIPLARGLGSSSAAIVAGLAAGVLASGREIDLQELVTHAARIEGHPDNVAPALFGFATVAITSDDRTIVSAIPVDESLQAVVFVPNTVLRTKQARAVLPEAYSRADAVFNLGRTALMVAALFSGRHDLLRLASEDRIHQPARTALVPVLPKLLAASLEAGALMSALSGAGPSVLALVSKNGPDVAAAMERAANEAGVTGRSLLLGVDRRGLQAARA